MPAVVERIQHFHDGTGSHGTRRRIQRQQMQQLLLPNVRAVLVVNLNGHEPLPRPVQIPALDNPRERALAQFADNRIPFMQQRSPRSLPIEHQTQPSSGRHRQIPINHRLALP